MGKLSNDGLWDVGIYVMSYANDGACFGSWSSDTLIVPAYQGVNINESNIGPAYYCRYLIAVDGKTDRVKYSAEGGDDGAYAIEDGNPANLDISTYNGTLFINTQDAAPLAIMNNSKSTIYISNLGDDSIWKNFLYERTYAGDYCNSSWLSSTIKIAPLSGGSLQGNTMDPSFWLGDADPYPPFLRHGHYCRYVISKDNQYAGVKYSQRGIGGYLAGANDAYAMEQHPDNLNIGIFDGVLFILQDSSKTQIKR